MLTPVLKVLFKLTLFTPNTSNPTLIAKTILDQTKMTAFALILIRCWSKRLASVKSKILKQLKAHVSAITDITKIILNINKILTYVESAILIALLATEETSTIVSPGQILKNDYEIVIKLKFSRKLFYILVSSLIKF